MIKAELAISFLFQSALLARLSAHLFTKGQSEMYMT